jgi:hypothetical protein
LSSNNHQKERNKTLYSINSLKERLEIVASFVGSGLDKIGFRAYAMGQESPFLSVLSSRVPIPFFMMIKALYVIKHVSSQAIKREKSRVMKEYILHQARTVLN